MNYDHNNDKNNNLLLYGFRIVVMIDLSHVNINNCRVKIKLNSNQFKIQKTK